MKDDCTLTPVYYFSSTLEKDVYSGYATINPQNSFRSSWKPIEKIICPICLQNDADQFSNICGSFHLIGCGECSKKLNKCPLCAKDIVTLHKVKYL